MKKRKLEDNMLSFERPTLPRRTTNQQLGLKCCSFNGRLEEKPNTAERIYSWLEMKFFTLPPSTTALAEWLKIIEPSGERSAPSRERENISTLKAAADLRQEQEEGGLQAQIIFHYFGHILKRLSMQNARTHDCMPNTSNAWRKRAWANTCADTSVKWHCL